MQALWNVMLFLCIVHLITSVYKDRTASILRIKQPNKMECLTLKMMVPSHCRETFTQLHSVTEHMSVNIFPFLTPGSLSVLRGELTQPCSFSLRPKLAPNFSADKQHYLWKLLFCFPTINWESKPAI